MTDDERTQFGQAQDRLERMTPEQRAEGARQMADAGRHAADAMRKFSLALAETLAKSTPAASIAGREARRFLAEEKA